MEKTESLIKKIKLFRKRIEDAGDCLVHEALGRQSQNSNYKTRSEDAWV